MKAMWTKVPGAKVSQKRERRPVRRVSKIKRKLDREDFELRMAWWQDPANKMCCVPGCPNPAEQRHHTRGRTRKIQNDPRFWAGICEPHHEKVKRDPKWAQNLTIYEGTDREQQLLANGAQWMSSKHGC